MNTVGGFIKSLRKEKKYSQRKLGILSGISHATINRIENGISRPTPETLKKLAKPLGTAYVRLLNTAGYLSGKGFIASNIKILRENSGMNYVEMARDIEKKTGVEISPAVLEDLEKGRFEDADGAYVDLFARYKGIDPGFFFRENTPESLAYAAGGSLYQPYASDGGNLSHVEDLELKRWILNPMSLEYLKFAKRLYDLEIDPDFVNNEFITRIFKSKTGRNK